MPVFLLRYQEPRMVSTNPRWCPYAKGSPSEGQAPRTSNSIESRRPSPRTSGAPLPASSWTLPAVFTIELPAEILRASFLLVHGGGCDKNSVVIVRKTFAPLDTILQWLVQEPRGFVGFSKLTQLTRNNLEQAHKRSN
jgi:hypothetical protein